MYLSLPVPKPPHAVQLTVLTLGYPEVPPAKCSVNIAKDQCFADLETRLSQELPLEADLCLAGPRRFVFGNLYSNRVHKLWSAELKIAGIQSYDDVWAFEVTEPPIPSLAAPAEEVSNGEA